MKFLLSGLVFLLLACPSVGHADTPVKGLAVAVSPNGKLVVAVGGNRVLYVLDPATLKVKERILLGISISAVWFAADGKHLLMRDTDGLLTWYSAENWKPTSLSLKVQALALPKNPAVFFAMNEDTEIVAVNASTAETRVLAKEFPCDAMTCDAKGESLFLWGTSVNDPKETQQDEPAQATDEQKFLHQQHHDQSATPFRFLDAKNGRVVAEGTTWLSSQPHALAVVNGSAVLMEHEWSMTLAQNGAVAVRRLGTDVMYGHAFSSDHRLFAGGNLACFTVGGAPNFNGPEISLDRLPGFPEYTQSFAFTDVGDLFIGTSAYRVLRATREGKIVAAAPIY